MAYERTTLFKCLGLRAQGDIGGLTLYRSKRGKLIFYAKQYPTHPASYQKERVQNRFKLAAASWKQLTTQVRDLWSRVARVLSLGCTGYNLWVFWTIRHDRAAIRTLEHQSGLTLIDDGVS